MILVAAVLCLVAAVATLCIATGHTQAIFLLLMSAGQNVPKWAGIPPIFGGAAGLPPVPADPADQPKGGSSGSPDQQNAPEQQDPPTSQQQRDERWKVLQQTHDKIFTTDPNASGNNLHNVDAAYNRMDEYLRN